MKSASSRSLALAIALSALVPSLLTSQTPPATRPAPRPRAVAAASGAAAPGGARAGRDARRDGPGARVGRGGGNPAAMLLRARQPLELTDDQVKRLEVLAAAPAPKSNASDMMRARADQLEAMQGDGNLAGMRAALDKLSRLRNDQIVARLKMRQDARAILTPAQKAKVDNMRRTLRIRAAGTRQRGNRMGRGKGRPGTGRGMGRGMMPSMGRGMMPGMGPGMMPSAPQGPQGPQGPMPRRRRGANVPDTAPPVPPAN